MEDTADLSIRLVELEIRSEERRSDIEALQAFVAGYEQRIQRLEREIERLREQAANQPEGLDSDERPPHY